jgi:hypothetical protein
VAREAGVTVFAVVLSEARPAQEVERIAARLGLAGADKVLFCEAPGLGGPPLDATHGPALHGAMERVPPLLVLFPAGGAGLQLGPPLAVRLGAAFAAAADIEVADSLAPLADSIGRVQLKRWRRDHSSYRRLDPVEMERPVVAILGAHQRPPDTGTEHVEVDVLECKAPASARVVELESAADDDAAIALARALVLVDPGHPGVGPDTAATLQAAAPPGVVVADLGRASAAAVAASTPEILVCIGTAEVPAAPSPLTRVGLILFGDAPEPARGTADVVWRLPAGAALDTGAIVAALAGLAASARAGAEAGGAEPAQ